MNGLQMVEPQWFFAAENSEVN